MGIERELLKGNTPTLILAVLRDAPLHGYGIAREIERRSGSALRFKEGTLYPALHALEREGLIAGGWEVQAGGPARKVYTIMPVGTAALERRTRAWAEFASALHRVLEGGGNEGTDKAPRGGAAGEPSRQGDLEPAG